MGGAVKALLKSLALFILLFAVLAGSVWLSNSDRLRHYPNNRVLNQSAISAIKTVGPVSAGFELVQRIDTTLINDSHPELFDLPVCAQVFLDATDGTYYPGTLRVDLIAGSVVSTATLPSSLIPHTFQRICFPQSSMRTLMTTKDASLRITVLESDAKNVARIVLTPLSPGQTPAQIDGQTSGLFLPHMIEVQRPLTNLAKLRVLALVAFASVALLIIFHGSATARRETTRS